MKRASIRQLDIARAVGVDQGTVSRVLRHRVRDTPSAEAVWAEIARRLTAAAD